MTTLVSTTPLNKVPSVREMLANKNAAGQLAAVAAKHLTPEKMMRTVALSISKNPKLAECSPMSLLGALMASANLGLMPNTPHGLAYLVPYGKEATLIVGYRGYIQLGYNSQQVAWVKGGIHYSDDEHWLWREGSSPTLEHTPGPMQGDMQHAYAIFERTSGHKTWVVWPEAKLVEHRDRYSQGYKADIRRGKTEADANVNIWLGNPDIARMKTMIRQIAKIMPMDSEMARAASLDGARADYQGYALDPSLGLPEPETIEGEAEINEAETVSEQPEEVQEKPVEQDQATPSVDGKAALSQAGKALREKAQNKKPEQKEPATSSPVEGEPDFSAAISEILNEAIEMGSNAGAVLDFHPDTVETIKAQAPYQFRELMKSITEIENGAGDA